MRLLIAGAVAGGGGLVSLFGMYPVGGRVFVGPMLDNLPDGRPVSSLCFRRRGLLMATDLGDRQQAFGVIVRLV